MGVVMLNKALLTNFDFKFPFLLTTCHMLTCSVLSLALSVSAAVPMRRCHTWHQFGKVAVLAAVFCSTVALGNVSLRYIPVSFNQAISATTPAFTAVLSFLVQGNVESAATYLALVPVVGGIVLASNFEPSFHATGFVACLSATGMRAVKSILQAVLLGSTEKLDSLSLLGYMAPLSLPILLPATFLAERGGMQIAATMILSSTHFGALLLCNCLLAYFVNLTNFLVTHRCGALTLQVLGNAKGAVAATLSILIFGNQVTILGCIGFAITLIGVVAYTECRKRSRAAKAVR